jgi:hypothetical protein
VKAAGASVSKRAGGINPFTIKMAQFIIHITAGLRQLIWSRVLLQKLTVTQSVKKLSDFYETRQFMNILKGVLSQMNPICRLTIYFFKIKRKGKANPLTGGKGP